MLPGVKIAWPTGQLLMASTTRCGAGHSAGAQQCKSPTLETLSRDLQRNERPPLGGQWVERGIRKKNHSPKITAVGLLIGRWGICAPRACPPLLPWLCV